MANLLKNGRSGRIRTDDPLTPSRVIGPIKLYDSKRSARIFYMMRSYSPICPAPFPTQM